MKNILLLFFSFLLINCSDTKKKITKDNYANAIGFLYANYNNKKVFNLNTNVNWFKDHSGFWFVDYSKNKKEYKTVDFKNPTKVEALFDHSKLAKSLSEILEVTIKDNDLSLTNIQKTEEEISFTFKDKNYSVHLSSYKITENQKEDLRKTNELESTSPDGKWLAFTKDYNLFIKSTQTNKEYQLSTAGKKGYEYASYYGWFDKMYGENGERPKRFSLTWSKDSKYIATTIVDTRNAEKMYLLDWSKDEVFKPELVSYFRGSPGDDKMVMVTPVFYNVDKKREVKTTLPTTTHINSSSIQWTNKSGVLLATNRQRGFKKEEVIKINLNTLNHKSLITEKSKTNVENFDYQMINDDSLVFYSERSGWRQLYLYDFKTDKTTMLTSDNYVVNDIVHIDKKEEIIYYLASGKEKESNPYHQQLYSVNFKGDEKLLTPENLHHQVSFSNNGKYFVDNMSNIQTETKTVLRNTKTGEVLTTLTTANIDLVVNKGWEKPTVFSLTAKDEETTIYGAFWKPTNFNASIKYPIIDATYTGPHTQRFPKSFNNAFSNQALAELGFIVVRIDGLGTAGRSKKFRDFSYKNMGNNLEDHVLAIKYLANKYSFIAIDKVGIYGHSAGGYDTGRALLAFPDFYKVGVASSADHDFRMEKAWWPEMYQGWPVDSTYHQISNITNAHNLKGKLLLAHGGLDDNVNPSATFKLAEALIKADKEFDLLILPSQRHGYTGLYRDYFMKKRWNYFIEHLLGQEPIWDFNMNL
ncbi:DPP IV N-terminal domain-containing protein [uncultured Polaribacter sp.]|uniref:S9 family peptidase n=1 Tax=uncultured Polaribacter sp. TaxID=174711 RepID=UPI00262CC944|nr:DPP IV N-terminal domain-containing protein [uncultured Polaribacter sp.]